MPKTKKKFINRKNAVTFNLVHRSQRDPLAADETAPQRVLVPVSANVPQSKEKDPELTPEQRKEEQIKYGIYFDDDYNYLQHLKDSREVTLVVQPKPIHKRKEKSSEATEDDETIQVKEVLNLPSSVFASEVEEDVGLLNKAAPQGLCLDLDPEVIAALDDDFDFDNPNNQLEDNFIDLAMDGGESSDDEDCEDEGDSMSDNGNSDKAFESVLDSDDDSDSDNRETKGVRMPNWDARDKNDTKSRYSSMTSSVITRNENLQLLDKRFEKMLAEYDDTEIGALDMEEIVGYMPDTHEMLLQAAEEFEESKRRHQLDNDKEVVTKTKRLLEMQEEEKEEFVTVVVEPKVKWDCKTILSTRSNLYNHPKIIPEPKKPPKIKLNAHGIPKDVLGKDDKLTAKSLAKFNAMNDDSNSNGDEDGTTNSETMRSTLSVLSIRPKNETAEEKKERKRLLKEYRKERRIEKKANKQAFKEERKRQVKIRINNRNNVQGNRIL